MSTNEKMDQKIVSDQKNKTAKKPIPHLQNIQLTLVDDASKYQNVKVSNGISWFYGIIAITITLIGLFLGIILCCLILIFV